MGVGAGYPVAPIVIGRRLGIVAPAAIGRRGLGSGGALIHGVAPIAPAVIGRRLGVVGSGGIVAPVIPAVIGRGLGGVIG